MELFERVLSLESVLGSKSAIARVLGITPQRLAAYANATSQKNLWHLLPNILQKVPDINRDWLYFDEGSMFRSAANADQTNENYTETIRILTETNRKLTEELLKRQ